MCWLHFGLPYCFEVLCRVNFEKSSVLVFFCTSCNYCLVLSLPLEIKVLLVLVKISRKTKIELFHSVLATLHEDQSLYQISLRMFATCPRRLQICEKALKFVLLDNYFPDLFTEVKIWYWKSFMFGLVRFFRKIKSIPAKIWLFLTVKAVNKHEKQNKVLRAMVFIMLWDFLVLDQILISPQVKRSGITINKHGIFESAQNFGS